MMRLRTIISTVAVATALVVPASAQAGMLHRCPSRGWQVYANEYTTCAFAGDVIAVANEHLRWQPDDRRFAIWAYSAASDRVYRMRCRWTPGVQLNCRGGLRKYPARVSAVASD